MPLVPIDDRIHVQKQNGDVSSYVQRAVVTTTLFTTPPSQVPDSPTSSPHTSLPVGAIAGGVVAGVILAILATVGWMWWGKTIRRQQAKQRKEAEALKKTKRNTLRNAHISKPQIHSYRPLFGRPAEQKIKFADSRQPENTEKHKEVERPVAPPVSFTREPEPQTLPKQTTPIFPRKANAPKPSPAPTPSTTPPEQSNLLPAKRLPHKPSNADSASVYSTASGEEHQVRVPPNLILAALGNLGGSGEVAYSRNSANLTMRRSASSIWSLFSRGNARLSQGSYDSANRYSGEPNGAVGIAL